MFNRGVHDLTDTQLQLLQQPVPCCTEGFGGTRCPTRAELVSKQAVHEVALHVVCTADPEWQ
jgi:hypothetical protein